MGMKNPALIATFVVGGRKIYMIGHDNYPYVSHLERSGDILTRIEQKGICKHYKDWETEGICTFCTKTSSFHLKNVEDMASNIKERGGYCGHEKDGEAGNLCSYCLCHNSNCSNRHCRNRRFWNDRRQAT